MCPVGGFLGTGYAKDMAVGRSEAFDQLAGEAVNDGWRGGRLLSMTYLHPVMKASPVSLV